MSGIEDLHPWLGKQKQQVQGRVTWSESKLMIGNEAIGEEEGFNVGSVMSSMTLLMIGRRLIGLSLQGSVFAPFLCRTVMFADFQQMADDLEQEQSSRFLGQVH